MARRPASWQLLVCVALLASHICFSEASALSTAAAQQAVGLSGHDAAARTPGHPLHGSASQASAIAGGVAAVPAHRELLQDTRTPGTNIQLRPTLEEPVPSAVGAGPQQQQQTPPNTAAAAAAAAWKVKQRAKQEVHQQERQKAQEAQEAEQEQVVSRGFLNHDIHKQLLPIDYKDVCLFILSFCVLSLAAGAGIGGGVLLVPMLSLITGFNSIETVALSNITIFCGAIANAMFNLPRKHPFKPGPLIDYDLLLLFGPPIVMGSIAGSYINYLVPGWVTKVLVLLVLSPMTWRMINKVRMLWVAENRRGSVVEQQSTVQWGSSVVGGSLELVTSLPEPVPEDKELNPGEGEQQGRGALQQPASTVTAAEAADSIRRHQHQLHLPPLTLGASARHSSHWGGGHVAGSSPPSAGGHSSSTRWPLAPRSAHETPTWGQQEGGGLQLPHRTHSHTNGHTTVLAALSDRPPSLADLLGPYFLVLTTPQVADATLQVQAQALNRHGTPPLQPSGSVTRRHTLGASQANSPCLQHTGSNGSRPSSAPTVPFDWDSSQGELDICAEVLTGCSPRMGAAEISGAHNPLAIISPFQLYQQQRCQQHAKQDNSKPQCCECGEQEHKLQEPCGCPELPKAAKDQCRQLVHVCCTHTSDLDAKMQQYIHHHNTAQLPKAHLAALLLMLAAVIITSITATLLLECGTWQYWSVVLTPLPLMLLVWGVMRWHVLWRVGWQNFLDMTHPTDIAWTRSSTLTFPAIVITVGVMAGMLGLGGGIVLAPLLLELGVQPAVSAASSQSAMLMSSCTSTVVYLVNQAMPKDYGIAMALIGFCGTLFGQAVFNYAVQRTGRSSILVFILAALFVLATAAGIIVVSNAVTAIVHTPAKLTMTHALDICSMRGG